MNVIENLLRAVTLPRDGHRYLSTYCLHGNHSECRLECKTCKSPCVCSCHVVKP